MWRFNHKCDSCKSKEDLPESNPSFLVEILWKFMIQVLKINDRRLVNCVRLQWLFSISLLDGILNFKDLLDVCHLHQGKNEMWP